MHWLWFIVGIFVGFFIANIVLVVWLAHSAKLKAEQEKLKKEIDEMWR